MLKYYIKTAFKALYIKPLFTAINLVGLITGMTAALLIFTWINDELGFDSFHENSGEIYRLISVVGEKNNPSNIAMTNGIVGEKLKTNIPDILSYTRYWTMEDVVKNDDIIFDKQIIAAVDPAFFDIFSFNFISGNAKESLSDPYSMILTEKTAKKLFGNKDPIGAILYDDMKVTGIIENFPENTHLQFDFIVPFSILEKLGIDIDRQLSFMTFLQLHQNIDTDTFSNKVQEIMKTNGLNEMFVQPFHEIHLYSDFEMDFDNLGDIKYIRIFVLLAFTILIIAIINFINLATAISLNKAKEIGLKKVCGASKFQIVIQFLGESLLLVTIAAFCSLALSELAISTFNELTPRDIQINFSFFLFIVIFALILIIGLISGSYPALYISSFKPITAIRGTLKAKPVSTILRKGLVILQFFISTIVVICTIAINSQLTYMQNKDPGFKRENIVCIPMLQHYDMFKSELISSPYIEDVSAATYTPINMKSHSTISFQGKDTMHSAYAVKSSVDFNFTDIFEIELIEGRGFSEDYYLGKGESFLINEEAVKRLNIETPIGSTINLELGNTVSGKIIGVLKDFHSRSYHKSIEPMILYVGSDLRKIFVSITPGNKEAAIQHIEAVYNSFDFYYPFDYKMISNEFNNQYDADIKLEKLFNYFTFLIIILSILGLFGLSLFILVNRKREISIRKILGASTNQIVILLSSDFQKLVLTAFLLACPVAWYILNEWLQNYTYRINISVVWFVFTGAVLIMITQVTIAFQAIKISKTNPVTLLGHE